MSKKIKAAIAVSILLNVLLTGMILGHVAGRLTHRHPPWRDADHPMLDQLSTEKRTMLLDTMQRLSKENRESWKLIREGRERALVILSAKDFNERDYMAEVARLDELKAKLSHNTTAATVALASGFSQEERKTLAGFIRHLPPRPPEERRGGARRPGHEEVPLTP
ncbi:MAG: periplasmic heavy metal sensor [Nitrospirae bacterium]|nr:periplasmic heavy metal sensor [Nitrospirota bacterium]